MAAATSLPLPLFRCLKSGVTHFPPSSPLVSVTSSNVLLKKRSKERFHHTTRTSSEGVPSELVEDSKFVPLNADDPVYGPPMSEAHRSVLKLENIPLDHLPIFDPTKKKLCQKNRIYKYKPSLRGGKNAWLDSAFCGGSRIYDRKDIADYGITQLIALLLMGFDAEETDKIQKFLKEFDGEFLKVTHCTEDMLTKSIWDAMHVEQPDLKAVKIAKSVPRICFLSGLTGEEMMMFIDAFPEAGLKPAVFAALVPNSADKLLMEVAEEIMGDHEMMSAKQQRN